jgi:hypothetical protein
MNLSDLENYKFVVTIEPKDNAAKPQTVPVNQSPKGPAKKEEPASDQLVCLACGTQLRLSKKGDAYTCPNWKDDSYEIKHTYKRK